MKHQSIIEKLTLEEKAGLCSGKDYWHFKGVERLGIDPIMVTDGPHGLRKQNPEGKKKGLSNSIPATCFPTAAATSCSWNTELIYKMGQALGDECRKEKVSVLLGPGVNMKRSPLCGRNFEYFSEDPYLAGKLAASFINGVQSKGIGTSIKHFAANSQEARRMVIDEIVDERALREIYLPAFEIAVKESQPWTVMNAYNRLNGTYCSENEWLQQKVLRDEWGFEGLIVTDWGASVDRVKGVKYGTDVEMPTSGELNAKRIIEAVKDGSLDEKDLDARVDNIIEILLRSAETLKEEYTCDMEANHKIARQIAGESAVLLKNEDDILPVDKSKKIAVIGEMAEKPRYQGAGSSLINPTKLDNALECLKEAGYTVIYARGYDKSKDEINAELTAEAVEAAKQADTVLVFAGLTEDFESEGYDRTHMGMPKSHNALIEAVAAANAETAVILSGGSCVEMPWLDKVKAVLNGSLGGQAGAGAIADIISGAVNPSGKLSETYPLALEDNPTYGNYPGGRVLAEHKESIYIGYRYYDTAKKPVMFPFGYGLSYTHFQYSDLKLSSKKIKDGDELTVSFKIKNTGDIDGAEVAQVYVKDVESTIFRPEKELKGFAKVFLKAGEEKEVSITLNRRAFAFYNVKAQDWTVESGDFEILVGASSADIRLSDTVNVKAEDVDIPDYRETAPAYYTADIAAIDDSQFEAVLGRPIPPRERDKSQKLTIYNNLEDAEHTKWGGKINRLIKKGFSMATKDDGYNGGMMEAMATQIPIRNFIQMSMGVFSEEMAKGMLMMINDEGAGKGFAKILSGLPKALKNLKNLLNSI